VDSHSLNHILRIFLQVAGLAGAAWWGYHLDSGSVRFFFLLGIPMFLITLWQTFNVKQDPFQKGEAPVRIRGGLRLLLEGVILCFATIAIYQSMSHVLGYAYLGLVIIHCLLSRGRILWMLRK
jgi:Protein of unknown function (DUF2568)